MRKTTVIALLLASVVALSGCAGAGGTGQNEPVSEAEFREDENMAVSAKDSDALEEKADMSTGILNPDVSIEEIPDGYRQESEQAGVVVRVDYQTPSYDNPSEMQDKYALVYLPYGYEQEKQYDILYLMHGGGGSQESSFSEGQSTELKCVLDHLIANGEMKPMIVVAPSFYPGGGADSGTSGHTVSG